MTEKKVIIIAAIAIAFIVCLVVAYVYNDKLKKALAEPKETFEMLKAELDAFLADEQTKYIISALCRTADELVGGTGQERLAYVCGKLYEVIPDYLQTIITIEKLQAAVNLVYEEIKEYVNGHWVAGK